MNTAQTVCEYSHSFSSDRTEEPVTETPEKVKEINGWECGTVRKTICPPFISVRELNQRATADGEKELQTLCVSVSFSSVWIVE